LRVAVLREIVIQKYDYKKRWFVKKNVQLCEALRTAKESCMLLDSAMFSDKKYNYQYGWFAKMLVQVS